MHGRRGDIVKTTVPAAPPRIRHWERVVPDPTKTTPPPQGETRINYYSKRLLEGGREATHKLLYFVHLAIKSIVTLQAYK